MLVQTTLFCLHFQFFRVQSVLQSHLTIFNCSGGAACFIILIGSMLVWSGVNLILRNLVHCPFPVSDNISESHPAVQHLR